LQRAQPHLLEDVLHADVRAGQETQACPGVEHGLDQVVQLAETSLVAALHAASEELGIPDRIVLGGTFGGLGHAAGKECSTAGERASAAVGRATCSQASPSLARVQRRGAQMTRQRGVRLRGARS
jgi:hypothetical protein